MLDALATPDVIVAVITASWLALLVEAANPGATAPGATGVALLVLVGALLDRSHASAWGLGLMVVALVLLGLEQHSPEPYAAAYGGSLLLMLGALLAFDEPGASRWVLTTVGVVAGTGSVVAARTARRVRYSPDRRPVHEPADYRGRVIAVDRASAGSAQSKVDGQWWTLDADQKLQAGQQVQILARQGLTLRVHPIEESPCPSK